MEKLPSPSVSIPHEQVTILKLCSVHTFIWAWQQKIDTLRTSNSISPPERELLAKPIQFPNDYFCNSKWSLFQISLVHNHGLKLYTQVTTKKYRFLLLAKHDNNTKTSCTADNCCTRAVRDGSIYIFSHLIWESGTDNCFNCHNLRKHEHEVQKPGSLYNPYQLWTISSIYHFCFYTRHLRWLILWKIARQI